MVEGRKGGRGKGRGKGVGRKAGSKSECTYIYVYTLWCYGQQHMHMCTSTISTS